MIKGAQSVTKTFSSPGKDKKERRKIPERISQDYLDMRKEKFSPFDWKNIIGFSDILFRFP